ncbi:MAG: RnfABCDGE type electron transport complex subunit D [Treponema sp.]|jgi:electron transport complex protein RnfD|nr:RnfABCDGE type electron transport complex subunit D [Treponema sp.]
MAENETGPGKAEAPKAAQGGKKPAELLLLSSSPHIASPVETRTLMANMLIALGPASVFGIVLFGLPALLTVLVSVITAVTAEALFRLAVYGRRGEIRVWDFSAALTGLLLALTLPPSTPFWMTALGAIFAVVVAKEFFGGLGANVFNPALSGRAFMLMSFPAAMTRWHRPPPGFPGRFTLALEDSLGKASIVDGVSGVTPLNIAKLLADEKSRLGETLTAGDLLEAVGKDFLSSGASGGGEAWDTFTTLFVGNHAGSIGESSILFILAGCAFLLITKTIDWRAPLTMTLTGLLASWVLGYDPLFSVLSGGLLFGAVFMATDYVTAPLTSKGKLIFGCGAGLIAVLIRKWGGYPEGVTYGILIMNALTPFLNRLLPRKYGYVPKKKPAVSPASGAAKGAS